MPMSAAHNASGRPTSRPTSSRPTSSRPMSGRHKGDREHATHRIMSAGSRAKKTELLTETFIPEEVLERLSSKKSAF
jgi:hypothetical protein